MAAHEDFTGLNFQEKVERFRSLLSFEGRGGLLVPNYEFDNTIDPPLNLLNLLNALWRDNGLAAGSDQPYDHERWVPADVDRPSLVIRGTFRGISLNGLAQRQQNLERYRELKSQLGIYSDQAKVPQTIWERILHKRRSRLSKALSKSEHQNVELKMEEIVSDDGLYQAGKSGLDLNGVRGVETHEILLPPTATSPAGQPEVFLRVSHSHFLPEERKRFDLPEWQGKIFPNRFIRYPYLGSPELETTFVWHYGQRLEAQDFPDPEAHSLAIRELVSETVQLLS